MQEIWITILLIVTYRQFDVAEPQHLFNALDEAAREDGALSAYGGITINSYFRSWAEKAGHPLLTVTINQTSGLMTVTQVNFILIEMNLC